MNFRCAIVIVLLLIPSATAAQMGDDRGQALYDRAVTAFQQGDFERAAELFGELYTLNPNPLVLYNRAYALGRAHNYAAAVESAALADLSDLDASRLVKNRARLVAYRTRLSAGEIGKDIAEAPDTFVASEVPPTRSPSPFLFGAVATSAVGAGAWIGTAVLDAAIGRKGDELAALERESVEWQAKLDEIEARQRIARPPPPALSSCSISRRHEPRSTSARAA